MRQESLPEASRQPVLKELGNNIGVSIERIGFGVSHLERILNRLRPSDPEVSSEDSCKEQPVLSHAELLEKACSRLHALEVRVSVLVKEFEEII